MVLGSSNAEVSDVFINFIKLMRTQVSHGSYSCISIQLEASTRRRRVYAVLSEKC